MPGVVVLFVKIDDDVDGIQVEDGWLRRIGPAHFSRINFRGTMRFGVEKFAAALIQRKPGQTVRWLRDEASGSTP